MEYVVRAVVEHEQIGRDGRVNLVFPQILQHIDFIIAAAGEIGRLIALRGIDLIGNVFEQRELCGQILRDERQLFRFGRLKRGVQRAGRDVEQKDKHQHAAGQRDGKIV